jgi:hypothetical protein
MTHEQNLRATETATMAAFSACYFGAYRWGAWCIPRCRCVNGRRLAAHVATQSSDSIEQPEAVTDCVTSSSFRVSCVRLHRLLNRLGPYQSLLILAIPLAIVEPLKLVALFVVGEGHFVAGVLIMIFAYAGSLFVTERLFLVLKPKLLTLSWFAVAWQWFVTVGDKLIYWLRRTWTRVRKAGPAF